jgi:hypothetical protein
MVSVTARQWRNLSSHAMHALSMITMIIFLRTAPALAPQVHDPPARSQEQGRRGREPRSVSTTTGYRA